MRGSIHLLPRETAHLPFGALKVPRSVEESRMRYFKLTEERYQELREQVLGVMDEPRSSAEIKKLLGGGDDLRYVLAAMAREGLLVRLGAEGLRSNALRWARPEPAIKRAAADKALAWLAGEYLRAYGPARPADFAWWTGADRKRTDAALATVDTVELDDGLLLRRADQADFEAAPRPRGIDLLPKWDMLTMGYPRDGRARFAADEVLDHCYDFRGDGNPLILRDGRAVAAWSMKFAGKRMEVAVDWFDGPVKGAAAVFEELAAVLGASALTGHA
jgi:hypothetical protein